MISVHPWNQHQQWKATMPNLGWLVTGAIEFWANQAFQGFELNVKSHRFCIAALCSPHANVLNFPGHQQHPCKCNFQADFAVQLKLAHPTSISCLQATHTQERNLLNSALAVM